MDSLIRASDVICRLLFAFRQKSVDGIPERCFCKFQPQHEISSNVVCATNKASDQPAHTLSLIRAFASRLNIL